MTEATQTIALGSRAADPRARLRRRHAAERRFKLYGIVAIAIALVYVNVTLALITLGSRPLLLGATFPEIRGVIAFVPASVVFQGIHPTWRPRSSWSLDGQGLPFVPYDATAARSGADLLEIYEASLRNEERFEQAVIPVERTNGPILLVSGGDDTIWPSTKMVEQVRERLARSEFPHAVEAFRKLPLSEEAQRKILWDNWSRLYGIPRPA